jgi:hypothetical protein
LTKSYGHRNMWSVHAPLRKVEHWGNRIAGACSYMYPGENIREVKEFQGWNWNMDCAKGILWNRMSRRESKRYLRGADVEIHKSCKLREFHRRIECKDIYPGGSMRQIKDVRVWNWNSDCCKWVLWKSRKRSESWRYLRGGELASHKSGRLRESDRGVAYSYIFLCSPWVFPRALIVSIWKSFALIIPVIFHRLTSIYTGHWRVAGEAFNLSLRYCLSITHREPYFPFSPRPFMWNTIYNSVSQPYIT